MQEIIFELREGDELFGVKLTSGNDEVLIAADTGKVIKFTEDQVRQMGRSASGVKGIDIDDENKVVGATLSCEGKYVLAVTTNGFGKMSPIEDYRMTNRGGKGVLTVHSNEKVGTLTALLAVNGDEDLIVTTNKGIIIRVSLEQIKIAGRNTQGSRIIRLDEGQSVATIAVTNPKENEEEVVEEVVENTIENQ